jgi:hypothetical protein
VGAPQPVLVAATKRQINALPITVFAFGMFPTEDAKCAICLGDYESNEALRSLPCVHYFHKSCVDQWLSKSRLCPLCTQDITTASDVHGIAANTAAGALRLVSSPAPAPAPALSDASSSHTGTGLRSASSNLSFSRSAALPRPTLASLLTDAPEPAPPAWTSAGTATYTMAMHVPGAYPTPTPATMATIATIATIATAGPTATAVTGSDDRDREAGKTSPAAASRPVVVFRPRWHSHHVQTDYLQTVCFR